MYKLIWQIFLVSIVGIHYAFVFLNIASLVILPFVTLSGTVPFYISVPIMTWIGNLILAPPSQCPLTRIENKIRERLGLLPIRGFIKHYFINPFRWMWSN
jgi:hypothetical protein